MVIYILTKFGADWLIFVDARVLTRQLWVDGWTPTDGVVSDHNSSLSTQCSGELKSNTQKLNSGTKVMPIGEINGINPVIKGC